MRPPRFVPLDDFARSLRKVLLASADLKRRRYRDSDATEGICYVAAEVTFHLRGAGLIPMVARNGETTHWWLENRQQRILDLNQWRQPSYRTFECWRGHRQNFLTSKPSKRARVAINRLYDARPDLVPPEWRPAG